MKFLLVTISLLALVSCGESSSNNNDSPKIIDTVEQVSMEEIEKACGTGSGGMSLIGEWTSDLIEERFPKMIVEMEFHDNGKAEITLVCRVDPTPSDQIVPSYNDQMRQTTFTVDGNNLNFGQVDPIELTLENDSANCRLGNISGDHMIGSLGQCLKIDIDNQTIYLKRN